LYDAVFGIEWIGDETLTWVHKHYGITEGDVSRVGKRGFATGGMASSFYSVWNLEIPTGQDPRVPWVGLDKAWGQLGGKSGSEESGNVEDS
jgi:hypothetical protein